MHVEVFLGLTMSLKDSEKNPESLLNPDVGSASSLGSKF